METVRLLATILATHGAVDSSPVEPPPVVSQRLDGVTVTTDSGRVQVLTDPAGNRRFIFEDGEIIAVDSSGRTWSL